MRTPEQKRAAIAAALVGAEATASARRLSIFSDRGISERTASALLARGIDEPERLLFVREADLKKIPGIGKVGFGEIMRYRARFLVDVPPEIGGDEDE